MRLVSPHARKETTQAVQVIVIHLAGYWQHVSWDRVPTRTVRKWEG
jgi:hypothetical protein